MNRHIIVGNDHGGYEAKLQLVRHMRARGLDVVDVGCDSTKIVRYPHYARKVAGAVARGEFPRGILLCSTGIGMCIAANKIKGVRASLCTDSYMARMTRQHNDSNVLCLGGKITGIAALIDILDAWLDARYIGGRHKISLGIIRRQEEAFGLTVPKD